MSHSRKKNYRQIFFSYSEKRPVANCAHCRPGVPCDPFSGACLESKLLK